MSTTVFLVVLFAAGLHAVWNALVKSGEDKFLGMAAIVLGQGISGFVIAPWLPLPAPESWPYIAASVVLHIGYQLFLLYSYRIGDLTQVYPLARGSAPLLVTLFSVVVLGIQFNGIQLFAVAMIVAGIASLGLVRHGAGQRNGTATVLALMTGAFIASYSIVDGSGARLAGTALGFYCWAAMGNLVIYFIFMGLTKPATLAQLPKVGKKLTFIGGGASFAAYALVVWAFTQAPIALVTALRETSIVFALLIGVFVLREPLNLVKVVSTMATLCGAALLRFAR